MMGEEKIVGLRARTGKEELERLNRITGLEFHSVPQSLLGRQEEDREACAESIADRPENAWRRDGRQDDGLLRNSGYSNKLDSLAR